MLLADEYVIYNIPLSVLLARSSEPNCMLITVNYSGLFMALVFDFDTRLPSFLLSLYFQK